MKESNVIDNINQHTEYKAINSKIDDNALPKKIFATKSIYKNGNACTIPFEVNSKTLWKIVIDSQILQF